MRDRADDAGPVVVVAVAAKEHAELRQHRDRAGDGRGDGHQQRVVIPDVRELMRDHAGEFLAAERLHQARWSRRPPRSRGCGRSQRHWAGLRPSRTRAASAGRRATASSATRSKSSGALLLVDLMGAVHRQHHAVRVPVGEQIGRGRDHERDQGAAGAADQIADAHEQAGETGQEHCRLEIVHCLIPAAHGRIAAAGIPEVGISRPALQDAGVRRGAAFAGGTLQAGLPKCIL